MKTTHYDIYIYIFSITFFVSLTGSAFAQTPYYYQKPYYYEKGVYSEKAGNIYFKDVVKTDLFSLASGDLSALYEHRFSNKFGLEGGAGYLLKPTSVSLMYFAHTKPLADFKSNAGYSLMIAPRFYSWNWVHYPFFRFRQYQHLTAYEAGYGGGYTFYLSKLIFAETSAYAGALIQTPASGYPMLYGWNTGENNHVVLDINLSIVIGIAVHH